MFLAHRMSKTEQMSALCQRGISSFILC